MNGQPTALAADQHNDDERRRMVRRSWPTPDPSYAVAHRISGWVDQAEVASAGVTVKRLIEWPDREGERIAA